MKAGFLFMLLGRMLLFSCLGIGIPGKVITSEYEDYVLTHELTPTGPIPSALDPNGVYPYVSYAETSNRPVLKKYRFIVLENDFLKVTICPKACAVASAVPALDGSRK